MHGILKDRFLEVIDNNLKSRLISKGYGFKKEKRFFLDLFEGFYLFENKKIKIKIDGNIASKKKIKETFLKKIKNFDEKYIVYKDFKEKGYIIKDGSIFGFDFRIYEKNKKEHTHTKYVVDVKKTHKDQMQKLIKSERLANSINATYILAIIDLDKKITKIKLNRF